MDINAMDFDGSGNETEVGIGSQRHQTDSDSDLNVEELSETEISTIKLYQGIKSMVDNSVQMIVKQRTARKKKRKRGNAAAGVAPDNEENTKAYSRCSLTYLNQVIKSISCSEHKKSLVKKMGFEDTLEIDDCYIPRAFVQWIADHMRPDEEVIKIDEKTIPINPKSFGEVLGIPAGELPVLTDEESGKAAFLECFGLSEVPNIRYFGDKIINEEELGDEDFCRCYGAVVLGTFICPNSSKKPSTKYLGALVDVENIHNRNWRQFAHDWMMLYIKKYLKERAKQNKLSLTLGGCIYQLAVRYLDFIDLGLIKLPPTLPRIRVWKGDLIKHFSEMDKGRDGNYGTHTVKDLSQTCYAPPSNGNTEDNCTMHQFRIEIDRVAGDFLCKEVKDELFNAFQNHMIDVDSNVYLRAQLLALDFLKIMTSEGSNRLNSETTLLMETQDSAKGQDDHEDHTQKKRMLDDHGESLGKQENDENQSEHEPSKHVRSFSLNHTPSGDDGISSSSVSVKCAKPAPSRKEVCNHTDIERNRQGVVIKSMSCIEQEYILPEPNPADFLTREEYLKEAIKKYYFLDPSVPSFRFFEYEDDNGKYIEEQELWRPLNTDINENVHKDCTQLDKQMKVNDLNEKPQTSDDLYLDDLSPSLKADAADHSFAYSPAKETTPLYKSNGDTNFEFSSIQCAQRQPSYTSNTHSGNKDAQVINKIELIVLDSSQPSQPSPVTPGNTANSLSHFKGRRLFEDEDSYDEMGKSKSPKPLEKNLKQNETPEVEYLGERSWNTVCNRMAQTTDDLYNAGLTLGTTSMSQGKENIPPKRVINRSNYLRSPFEHTQRPVPDQSEIRLHETITTLCDDEDYSYKWVINIDNCRVSLKQLGSSMKPEGWVEAWLMNAFCRKLFKDNHPRKSNKHWFFHTSSEYFLEKWPNEYMRNKWRENTIKGFHGADSARKLHLSNRLHFPSLYEGHWFVFLVDMKGRRFMFLDSYYEEGSSYHQSIQNKMITNFKKTWVESNLKEVNFDSFDIFYPNMPKQKTPNDCGIFVMKFMEFYCPRNPTSCSFSSVDIIPFRVKGAVDILFNEYNSHYEYMELIRNFDLKTYKRRAIPIMD